MTKTLEVRGLNKNASEEKIKKEELLRLMRVLDVNSCPRRVIRGSGKVTRTVPRKLASGTRLSQATLGLLRQYFAVCVALRREYNGVEGV
mgnify:CR=1 FL=1